MENENKNLTPFEIAQTEIKGQENSKDEYTYEDCTWAVWTVEEKKLIYAESPQKLRSRDQDCFEVEFDNPPVLITSDNYFAVSGIGNEILIFKKMNLINGD